MSGTNLELKGWRFVQGDFYYMVFANFLRNKVFFIEYFQKI